MKPHAWRLIVGVIFAIFISPAWSDEKSDNVIGRFEIVRFAVDGNTLLPPHELDQLLLPYAGKNRDFSHVQRALEALEHAYHKRGFNVVRVVIPEQELNQGVVHFRVAETRIGKVHVGGNKNFDTANIRRSLPGLREGTVPNIDDISASLRMANENPAKKTRMQLKNSSKDSEIDVDLQVEDSKAWTVAANLDNTGNANTGNHHVGALFQHANFAGLDHVLSMQYTTTTEKPEQVSVYGFGYHIPMYYLGDSIDVYGSYSDVDSGTVSAALLNLQISGKGTVAGARYNQNLSHDGSYDSKLSYGVDYKAYKNNIQLLGVQLGNDVTVHPISLSYAGVWTGSSKTVNFSLTGLHNIPGGEQGSSDDFNRARTGAPTQYNILRYAANYTQALPKDWQMRWVFNGQYTADSLIPGEQFGAGGASSVRGFPERELSNDAGNFISAELYTPNLCKGTAKVAMQCRLLGFSDFASVSRNNPLPGEQTRASIGSVGAGLRVNVDKYLNWLIDVGHVVDGGPTQVKGTNRVHFKLGISY